MKRKCGDFKRLADDTKKTEQKAKLYHMGLIVNLIIIIVIVILTSIVLFIKPDLFSNQKGGTTDNVDVSEEVQGSENKIIFSEFKVVSKYNDYYIIGNLNGTWKEVTKVSEDVNIIGTNGNKLYCYNDQGLQYINFEKEPYQIEDWIKYKQYVVSETEETGTLRILDAYMLGDNIYFKYGLDIVSTVSAGGILSIDIRSNSLDDAVQVLPDVKANEWTFDSENSTIYYLKNSKELLKYNIESSNEELILSDVKSFQIEGEKILYLKVNNSYREPGNAVVQAATYDLCLYDINSGDSKVIYESPVYNVTTGSLKWFAKYYDNDIYYKKDNKIIKYENGSNEVIYTHESSELNGFDIQENGIIELIVENNETRYLVNGQALSKMPKMYTVTMEDGTEMEF